MSRSALVAAAVALAGCHARWNPLASAPGYSLPQNAEDGVLGRKQEVTLSGEDNHYLAAFRYELPAAGALLASARAVDSTAPVFVSIHAEGGEQLAKGEPGNRVEAAGLSPGTYYVAVQQPWRDAVRARVELRAVFKPQDPDAAQQACRTQATARELGPEGQVEDGVDYSAQRRTCWWRLTLPAEGALQVRFGNNGANISAELVPAQGAPEKIDPAQGLSKPDLPAGEYFVKVYADEAGDAGRYSLATSFKPGDTCKNEPHCSPETAEALRVPADSKSAEVDLAKGRQFHFYRASLKEKGKLTISFKVLQPPRGSKVAAYFMKSPDDAEGEKISAGPVTREIEGPGEVYIRVQAPGPGDAGRYAIQTLFQPDNYITGDVVEIARNPCLLTVSAGANQGVRTGALCTVVTAQGQGVDGCQVDQVFPNLSKVKPQNSQCRVHPNSKVQISAQ